MSTGFGTPIEEIQCSSPEIPEHIYTSESPVVLRGLVTDWPIVKASRESNQKVVSYLNNLYNGNPVNAFLANPEAAGRIFYNESVDGFNFQQSKVYLDDALNKIVEITGQENPPTYYVGSLEIHNHLPNLGSENKLELKHDKVRESIWLGNRSIVAPHFDFPDNLACCVIGQRRFTLFPPEQLHNLYIGPLDFTPAGQAISMVDMKQPDLKKYPRFEEAMETAKTAELSPGDAVFIPSMWWHSVESLSGLNGLINYWWSETPGYLGAPHNALLHAILSIKYLPKRQREAWKNIFNEHVFEQPDDMYDHLPEQIKLNQSNMNEMVARKLRTQLINKLR